MTDKTTKNPLLKNDRDEAIGKALAATIVEQEVIGECLSDEEMAAIIDGNLTDPDRDPLMKHLSSCKTCFTLFSMSKRHVRMQTIQPQRNRFLLPSAAIAIAALLALILKISFQGNTPDKPVTVAENRPSVTNSQKQTTIPSPVAAPTLPGGGVATVYLPPSAAETVRLLVRGSDVIRLLAAVPSDRGEVYGFSGALPPEKRAFRLGVMATDLELSIQANERESVVANLKHMAELMPLANQENPGTSGIEKIIHEIEQGSPLHTYKNSTALIEQTITGKDEQLVYHLGVWAEGGRLAASVGNKGYFDTRSVRYIMAGIKDMQLPSGVLKELQSVEGIIEKGAVTEKELIVIKRALEDVTAIF